MIKFNKDDDKIALKFIIDPELIVDDVDESEVAKAAIKKARKDKARNSVRKAVTSNLLKKDLDMCGGYRQLGYQMAVEEVVEHILDEYC